MTGATTFVLIPGAGGAAWYWSRVVTRLEAAGHEAIAVDLPADDEHAGLPEYTDLVLGAMNEHTRPRTDVALVAQSLGGFTAAMVAARAPVRELVFVNAMIPNPGETAGEWWTATGSAAARDALGYGDFDERVYFLHDVPDDVIAEGQQHQRPETDAVFGTPCAFERWPSVPIRVLVGADDRFFPCRFQRRVARERLGIEADVRPGGHLMALSQPAAVAAYLLHEG